MRWFIPLLVPACLPPAAPSGSTASPTGSGSTASGSTAAPPPLACSAVTGTTEVYLISRADPSVVVAPAEPLAESSYPSLVAGPDALGRLYLVDRAASTLLVSSDDGCSWTAASAQPGLPVPITSPASPDLYLVEPHPWRWEVSHDGGVTFQPVEVPGNEILGVSAGPAGDVLHVGDDGDVLRSDDGGLTWWVEDTSPSRALSPVFDPWDPDRWAAGSEEAWWVRDATGWTSSTSDDAVWTPLRPRWAGGGLVLQHGATRALTSPDGLPPYDELSWSTIASLEAVDGDDLVLEASSGAAGILARGGAEYELAPSDAQTLLGSALTPSSVVFAFTASSFALE